MREAREEFDVLLSAYVDGELDETESARLETLLKDSPELQREYQAMQRLVVGTSRAFAVEDLPDDVWDDFLDNVYNRLERKLGWIIFSVGVSLLGVYGMYAFVTQPFASALLKILLALPLLGLGVVFWSVLRNRLHVLRSDRYTREVHR